MASLACGSQARAGPDAIGSDGNDPGAAETFERGQAIGITSDTGFVIFPIPISNPAVGYGLGLATGVLYQMDEGSEPSYTGLGAFGTSNGSWGGGALQHFSLRDDRYRLSAGIGYASVHYDIYGIGSAAGDAGFAIPVKQQGYFANPSVAVRIAEDLHVGIQYRIIDAETHIDAGDQSTVVGRLLGGQQVDFVSSGFGPLLDWDTRDDSFWPSDGELLHAEAVFASGSFLSDFDYRKALVNFNLYRENFADGVLAVRIAGCFAGGDVPVIDLCLFGAHNDIRGYETGRYRDETALAAQIEQRWMFAKRWGVVGFAGIGGVGPSIGDALEGEPLAAGGVGIRYQASESYRVNVAVDGAVNLEGDLSLYFRIGEAF